MREQDQLLTRRLTLKLAPSDIKATTTARFTLLVRMRGLLAFAALFVAVLGKKTFEG